MYPMKVVFIFSDGLDLETCLEIYKHCKGKIGCSFGVGTNLTNDVGVKPLNMVIKLTKINATPNPTSQTPKKEDYKFGEINPGKSLPVDYTVEGEVLTELRVGDSLFISRTKRNGIEAFGLKLTTPLETIR
jgi:nicotinic acid phosphoribosyltransferase